jgi:hypothetical protein
LVLPAFDSGGVRHETARIACAILADCRWDGYFSLARNEARLDDADADTILTAPQYYFFLEPPPAAADSEPYPVVLSFDHFTCPGALPPSWSTLSLAIGPSRSERVGDRDGTCRITSWGLPVEIAHIVPLAESEWWRRNRMALFARRPEVSSETNCVENALLLREDVHTLWDRQKFCIVPKAGRWVAHVIDNATTRELEETYHNIPLQPLLQVCPTYLLARFALCIFSAKPVFIKLALRPRRVVKVDENNQKSVQTLPSSPCRLELERPRLQRQCSSRTPSKSTSRSPSKRPRGVADLDGGRVRGLKRPPQDWEAEQRGDNLWDQPQCGNGAQNGDDDEEEGEDRRGRPRKRRLHPPRRQSARSPSPCSTETHVSSRVSDENLRSSLKGGSMDLVVDVLEEEALL